jgi:hypothetical protein
MTCKKATGAGTIRKGVAKTVLEEEEEEEIDQVWRTGGLLYVKVKPARESQLLPLLSTAAAAAAGGGGGSGGTAGQIRE